MRERTQNERCEDWSKAIAIANDHGWTHVNVYESTNDWLFRAPSGTVHDLSCADMTKLDQIEDNLSFLQNIAW